MQLRKLRSGPDLNDAGIYTQFGRPKYCSKCGEREPVDRDCFESCNGGKNVRGVSSACIRANAQRHHRLTITVLR